VVHSIRAASPRSGGVNPLPIAPISIVWKKRLRAKRHIAPLMRDYCRCGPLVVRPAESSMLEHSAGSGWIAIGDAAASYDPIAFTRASRRAGMRHYCGCACRGFLPVDRRGTEHRHWDVIGCLQQASAAPSPACELAGAGPIQEARSQLVVRRR